MAISLDLHTERLGVGPPLVILHGLFGSGTNWRTLARQFAESFDVILVDARNHGRSPHAPAHSYVDMSADLLHTMDCANVQSAHLLGHSMGGKTAMWTALTAPSRVRSLLVADIAPVTYDRVLGDELSLLQNLDLNRVRRRADADEQLAEHIAEAGLREFLLQNLVLSEGRASWRLNLTAIAQASATLVAFPDTEQRYTGTTRFVDGGASNYIQASHEPQIRRLFPNATHKTIDGASHWLHAEQPQQFFAIASQHMRTADLQ